MGASVRRCGTVSVFVCVFLALAGCKAMSGPSDVTGSVGTPTQEAYRKLAETWGKRYQSSPGEKAVSLNYARALRGMGEPQQAASVLQQAAARNPDDAEITAAYGKALVEIGQFEQARAILARAHTPDMPNPRVLSAQGVIADQSGDHAQAQTLYRSALKQDPNDPIILTNLGLSLLISKQPQDAEAILRRAIASPRADARMRETLALALIVNGKSSEAIGVLGVDLPAEQAKERVAALSRSASSEGLMAAVRTAQVREKPLETVQAPAPTLRSSPKAEPAAKPLALKSASQAVIEAPKVSLRAALPDQ